ncbi:hypothetical protein P8C59_005610 [Phyllachora maydis]|uniref:Uncharacterized protein n=1 Tax=Phyllachora maydis TaxID=1825666 RepID=A0AAD9I5Y1_9PEZI|nr:hypothetical protein P8C59_005610 [Phyllachora maydis]
MKTPALLALLLAAAAGAAATSIGNSIVPNPPGSAMQPARRAGSVQGGVLLAARGPDEEQTEDDDLGEDDDLDGEEKRSADELLLRRSSSSSIPLRRRDTPIARRTMLPDEKLAQDPDGLPPMCWVACFNDKMADPALRWQVDQGDMCHHLEQKKNKHFLGYRKCIRRHCSHEEREQSNEDRLKTDAAQWFAKTCKPATGEHMYGFPAAAAAA